MCFSYNGQILKYCEFSLAFQNSVAYPKFTQKPHVLVGQEVTSELNFRRVLGFQDFLVFWLAQNQ